MRSSASWLLAEMRAPERAPRVGASPSMHLAAADSPVVMTAGCGTPPAMNAGPTDVSAANLGSRGRPVGELGLAMRGKRARPGFRISCAPVNDRRWSCRSGPGRTTCSHVRPPIGTCPVYRRLESFGQTAALALAGPRESLGRPRSPRSHGWAWVEPAAATSSGRGRRGCPRDRLTSRFTHPRHILGLAQDGDLCPDERRTGDDADARRASDVTFRRSDVNAFTGGLVG
jgi:hypothetical protein